MPDVASHVHQHILRFWKYIFLITLIFFPPLYASNAGARLKAIVTDANPRSDPVSIDNIEPVWIAYSNKHVAEWKVIFTLACVLVG